MTARELKKQQCTLLNQHRRLRETQDRALLGGADTRTLVYLADAIRRMQAACRRVAARSSQREV